MQRCLLFLSFSFIFIGSKAQNITWAKDVACIIYSHCSSCHNENGVSELPLLNYQNVFDNRLAVELAVNTRKMPPLLTRNSHSKVGGMRQLTQQEIEIIREWALGLALEGDTALAPDPPVFTKPTVSFSSPHLSFKTNFQLPDTIEDHIRRCFVYKSNLGSDTIIKSIEVVPSDATYVHAVYVYSDTSSQPIANDLLDPEAGYSHFFGIGSPTSKPIYGWMLGSKPFYLPGDLGVHLDSGAFLVVQVQYADEGGGQFDSTIINIVFDTVPSRAARVIPLLSHISNLQNGPFEVPVDSTIRFHESSSITEDISLLTVSPNLHYFCDHFFVFAIEPNGDTTAIIKIDDWDPGWSGGTYYFERPIHLQKNSTLQAFAEFSNTILNQHDFNDTLEVLHSGMGEDEEEMIFHFAYLPYKPGDELIHLDSSIHFSHFLNCQPSADIAQPYFQHQFSVYPNPSNGVLHLVIPDKSPYSLTVLNSLGESVLFLHETSISAVDLSGLNQGLYYIKVLVDNKTYIQKFIKE